MDKPIQRGDLVMVVRPIPCCGTKRSLGLIFRVASVVPNTPFGVCLYCRARIDESAALDSEDGRYVGISRLKRLDPDALKDDIPTGEEIAA